MQIQRLSVREQIVKTVVKSGNGGAIWVPKDWLGEEVVVILPEKPTLSLKERILNLLGPYLKDVMSVGIYGSYARKEQTKDSDVDVLVITKDKKIRLNFKEDGLDAISLPIDKLRAAIQKYPVVYYHIIKEAEPLINAYALEELKNIKIRKESFKDYLKETKEHIKSNMEFLELDKLDYRYVKSYSVLYSAMLRLRGLFIINCFLNEDSFSNKAFKRWIINKGLKEQEYEDCYKAYRFIRDEHDIKSLKIAIEVAEKALNILKMELELLEEEINDK